VRRARATAIDLSALSDERLAVCAGAGEPRAFELLFERHHAALLAFCRHMLSSREAGEDALQQTFLRAIEALRRGAAPDHVRAWLFTIARNRCLAALAGRRPTAGTQAEDGVMHRRDELSELVADVARLPSEQRAALVLAELADLPQAQTARVLGVGEPRVKALIYQARQQLIAERAARGAGCDEVRTEIAVARGPALRRAQLRRHLRHCPDCRAFREEVAQQRTGLAAVLPIAAGEALRSRVLDAAAVALASGQAREPVQHR
jgi:RNA polymerase sigma factor (sigma-70 family)